MSHTPLVFIDIETTGLSARTGGRVLEVGALRVEDHKIVSTYSQLIQPEVSVPHFITHMTGISDSDVAGAPLFHEISDDIERLTKDAIFVAHNVNFDYRFIQSEFASLGKAFHKNRLCTVRLSRTLFPHHKSHALDRIVERHGFDVENRHRAYNDAEILYKFYMHLLQEMPTDLFRAITKNLVLTTR